MPRVGQTPTDDAAIVQSRLQQGTANNPGIPANLVPLVVAQAQHESDNFSSPVFNNTNNAFGYTTPSSYGVGVYEGYSIYNSVDDSASEIVDYLYRRQADGSFPDLSTITTADQYASLLSAAGYYTDTESNYAAGIESWLQQNILNPIENNPIPSLLIGALVIVGLALLFSSKK